jgi:hypothetical protein
VLRKVFSEGQATMCRPFGKIINSSQSARLIMIDSSLNCNLHSARGYLYMVSIFPYPSVNQPFFPLSQPLVCVGLGGISPNAKISRHSVSTRYYCLFVSSAGDTPIGNSTSLVVPEWERACATTQMSLHLSCEGTKCQKIGGVI